MPVYCFHYFLSILHSADNNLEHKHSHTLEIVIYLSGEIDKSARFDTIEKYAEDYLRQYENEYLNILPEFEQNANIENIGDVFFEGIERELEQHGLLLERLEIGETPLRTYIVTREL